MQFPYSYFVSKYNVVCCDCLLFCSFSITLFFFSLIQFCQFETVNTGLADELEKYSPKFRKYKWCITLTMSIVCFLLGLPLVCEVSLETYAPLPIFLCTSPPPPLFLSTPPPPLVSRIVSRIVSESDCVSVSPLQFLDVL